ncbi:MAG TPA: hypothetical protein VIK01_24915 [Polyangiaceae bacterium]
MTRFVLGFGCVAAAALLTQACSSYFGDGPDPSRDGRVDAGAAGAASIEPTQLVSGVSVNALALDADTVYFTSNQGLAKVAKQGGSAVPLGGFSQLNGLAVDARAIYAVNSNGALFSVHKNGTSTTTLSTATCGGGAGAVAISADSAFFSTGPYLRNTPISGGTTSDLTSNVWQAGGQASAARIALDAQNAYYIGSALTGGLGALYGVAQAGSGMSCVAQLAPGTRLASAKGTIGALAGDGTRLYFTDLTSNGLSPVLVVSVIVAPSLAHATVIDLGKITAEGNNNTQTAGNALASDGTHLYFGGFSGIYRVLVGGPTCSATALPCSAPELVVTNAMPTALAVDTDSLYYGDQNGNGLKKVAK